MTHLINIKILDKDNLDKKSKFIQDSMKLIIYSYNSCAQDFVYNIDESE